MDQGIVIVNGTLIKSGLEEPANVYVREGKIAKITAFQSTIPRDVKVIDAESCYVAPGFIDFHVHGTGEYDATVGDVESIEGIARSLVRFGVTSFVPTLMSAPTGQCKRFLESVKSAEKKKPVGAKIIGAHLEGPFINPLKRGVHPVENLKLPSVEAFREIVEGYEQVVKIITLAPELPDADLLIAECKRAGIVAAIGHTNATFQEATHVMEKGITHSTHTFNAMRGIEARDLGAVGAVLLSKSIVCEIICNGFHGPSEQCSSLTRTEKTE